MSDQTVDVFFYGLFMDPDHLRAAGLVPQRVRRASASGWALRIGRRATLVASADARSYGMLIALTPIELDQLYSAPGVENYQPTTVLAETLDAPEPVRARCYPLLYGGFVVPLTIWLVVMGLLMWRRARGSVTSDDKGGGEAVSCA